MNEDFSVQCFEGDGRPPSHPFFPLTPVTVLKRGDILWKNGTGWVKILEIVNAGNEVLLLLINSRERFWVRASQLVNGSQIAESEQA